jgi:predicted MFS family arabinose efflux permease
MLFSLAAIQFTNIVDFMIMMPMGDLLQRHLEIGPEKYGWLVSSYGLAAFATAFAGVFYLDRLNRKTALMAAYLGFSIATLSSAILPSTGSPTVNYALFVFTRVLTGLTGGLLGGLVYSIVGDLIPIERRGKAMAVVTMAFSLAAVIGVPLSLALVDGFGNHWRSPFLFVSTMSLFVLVLSYRFIPNMSAKVKFGNTGIMKEVWMKEKLRWALLFTFSLILGQFTVISFMTPYFINNVGLLQSDIKFIYIAGGIATIISGPVFGALVDRFGRFRVFYGSALSSLLNCLRCIYSM